MLWGGCRWSWQFNEEEDRWCLKELQGERGWGGGDKLDTLSSFDGVAQTWFHFQIKRRSASFPHFKIFHLSQVNWRFTILSFWTVVSFLQICLNWSTFLVVLCGLQIGKIEFVMGSLAFPSLSADTMVFLCAYTLLQMTTSRIDHKSWSLATRSDPDIELIRRH